MKDTITISIEEYEYLQRQSFKLDKLEAYGVDNWCGYSDAMSDSDGIFEEDEDPDNEE